MKKVLISAPYMVREKEKVEKMFIDYNYEFELANVIERLEEEEILKIISKYHGIICGDDRLTPRVLDKASNLEVIVKWGTGIDAIDKKYAEKKGIPVYNTPNAFTEPVSETTIAFMLSLLEPKQNQKILEIGSGSGYALSLISEIIKNPIIPSFLVNHIKKNKEFIFVKNPTHESLPKYIERGDKILFYCKKEIIAENRARGKSAEDSYVLRAQLAGYEVERTGRGHDFRVRKRDLLKLYSKGIIILFSLITLCDSQ